MTDTEGWSPARETEATPLTDERRVRAFAAWVFDQCRDGLGDLDGGDVQDKAEELGLLERREVTDPDGCGGDCDCRAGETCIFPTPLGEALLKEASDV